MPIQVHCSQCKAGFQAKDEHAGKRAKCPKCGQVLTIPGPAAPAPGARKPAAPAPAAPEKPEPAVAAGRPAERTCPSCGAGLAEKAILCVACGYNLSTGQKLVRVGAAAPSDAAAEPAARCEACGAPMAAGVTRCIHCGVSASAMEVQPRSSPRPRGPTRWHIAALAAVVVVSALAGVLFLRTLFRDYGAQFAAIIGQHKSLAKFALPMEPNDQPSSLAFAGRILVCTEDGRVRPGFTDPDDRRYLARNPSEVHTIVFVRETKKKVSVASGMAPVMVPEGMGVPTTTAIRVACQVCAVDCDSKSWLGEDVFFVDPMASEDSVDVAASSGTGMVALEIAKWIERNVKHTNEY